MKTKDAILLILEEEITKNKQVPTLSFIAQKLNVSVPTILKQVKMLANEGKVEWTKSLGISYKGFYQITDKQKNMLDLINKSVEPIKSIVLAQKLNVSAPSIFEMVTILERKGMVITTKKGVEIVK